jgi:hypothetical protein
LYGTIMTAVQVMQQQQTKSVLIINKGVSPIY